MRMPGFLAILSICDANDSYQIAASLAGKSSRQELVPQLSFPPGQEWNSNFRPALRCTPCIRGRQYCCPPPGLGMPCLFRSCWGPFPLPNA